MKKILKGFSYAGKGLSYAFTTQVNFKIHIIAAVTAVGFGIYTGLNISEWLWICLCIGLVLIFELINTAIETLVDLVSPAYNSKAGIIKDVAAAAVLLSALLSVVIGLIIFLPKLMPGF